MQATGEPMDQETAKDQAGEPTHAAGALALQFAAGTDVGLKRSNNQDSFGFDVAQHIYVVCDGMGGMAGGEVASSTAVRRLIESYEQYSRSQETSAVEARLSRAIHDANASVREAARATDALNGMGTTLVCACLDGSRIVIGNVGDSRAYFMRQGMCFQVTQDHSFIGEQLRQGRMTPETAAASEFQSVITRAIGVAEKVEPDFYAAALEVGDLVLLASDGLTRYIDADEIASMMANQPQLPAICDALIDKAKERGGADNITVLILRAVEAA